MGCRSLRRGGVLREPGKCSPRRFLQAIGMGPQAVSAKPKPTGGARGGGGRAAPPAGGRPPAPLHFSLDSQGALAVVYISINVGSRL